MEPFVVDRQNLCGADVVIRGSRSGVQFVLTPEPEGCGNQLETLAFDKKEVNRKRTYTEKRLSVSPNRMEFLIPRPNSQLQTASQRLGSGKSSPSVGFSSPLRVQGHHRRKSFQVKPRLLVPPPDFVYENIRSVKKICQRADLASRCLPRTRTMNAEMSHEESTIAEDGQVRNQLLMKSCDMGEISEDEELFAGIKEDAVRRKSMLATQYRELLTYLSPAEPRSLSPCESSPPPDRRLSGQFPCMQLRPTASSIRHFDSSQSALARLYRNGLKCAPAGKNPGKPDGKLTNFATGKTKGKHQHSVSLPEKGKAGRREERKAGFASTHTTSSLGVPAKKQFPSHRRLSGSSDQHPAF